MYFIGTITDLLHGYIELPPTLLSVELCTQYILLIYCEYSFIVNPRRIYSLKKNPYSTPDTVNVHLTEKRVTDDQR